MKNDNDVIHYKEVNNNATKELAQYNNLYIELAIKISI